MQICDQGELQAAALSGIEIALAFEYFQLITGLELTFNERETILICSIQILNAKR